jgi:hypothetical protein
VFIFYFFPIGLKNWSKIKKRTRNDICNGLALYVASKASVFEDRLKEFVSTTFQLAGCKDIAGHHLCLFRSRGAGIGIARFILISEVAHHLCRMRVVHILL